MVQVTPTAIFYVLRSEYIQWYIIKTESNGWHVDGIWTQATKKTVSIEAPVATEEAKEESDVEATNELNSADDATVIATSVSPQVTEAPATESQPVDNDEKNIEAIATPDVIQSEKVSSKGENTYRKKKICVIGTGI